MRLKVEGFADAYSGIDTKLRIGWKIVLSLRDREVIKIIELDSVEDEGCVI